MNGKTTKQEWAAPIFAIKAMVVARTLGTPGLAGEPLAGFFIKVGV